MYMHKTYTREKNVKSDDSVVKAQDSFRGSNVHRTLAKWHKGREG